MSPRIALFLVATVFVRSFASTATLMSTSRSAKIDAHASRHLRSADHKLVPPSTKADDLVAEERRPELVPALQASVELMGRITDHVGAPIIEGTVVAVNEATTRTYSARSDNEGRYRIGNLPPGDYDVSAKHPAFIVQTVKGVFVGLDSATTTNFTLLAVTSSVTQGATAAGTTVSAIANQNQTSRQTFNTATSSTGLRTEAGHSVALASLQGVTASTQYLQSASERFQHSADVYSAADAAGNHFAARGEIDSNNGLFTQVPAMDEISTNAPCMGITCITATYDPNTNAWGGWYFLNGILGPTDREPSTNWGSVPDAGYDLTGATVLQFWARGNVGGERVQFFAFGVGNTAGPLEPYPDSAPKATTPIVPITLSTTWAQYQIPLVGLDIHYVLGGFGWIGVKTDQINQASPITFYLDKIQYVKDRTSEPRLLVSYETIKSTDPFDTVMRNAAFTYDNAVALIALAAAGDITRSQYTADALLFAQSHDRYFTDNRLRNAYQGGDMALPPGWLPNNHANTARMPGWYDSGHKTWFEDATQVSSNTGNIAWAMIADLDVYDVTQQQKYLQSAQLLGEWVINNTSAAVGSGFTGGFDGWENQAASGDSLSCASGEVVKGQCKRHYKATEHNVDLYSAFSHLYMIDPSAKWASAAQQAKTFVLSMWDPSEGKFWTGTIEDEVTISKNVIPLDIQVWALEALGTENQSFLPSLAYIESHHKTSNGYGFKQNDIADHCNNGTWFEGTSQVALAYELTGNTSKAQEILATIHSFQNPSSGSVPATDGGCVNTGFLLNDGTSWLYYPRPHVGATAWLSIAESSMNPFRADLYSPSLSPSSLIFGKQNTGTTSGFQTITITNKGTASFSIATTSFSGPNPKDFSVFNNGCQAGVPVGASCAISVVFNPEGIGTRTGSITVTEAQIGTLPTLSLSPIALTGTGCEILSSSSDPLHSRRRTLFAAFFGLPLLACFRQQRRRMLPALLALLVFGLCFLQFGCGSGNDNPTTTTTVQTCG